MTGEGQVYMWGLAGEVSGKPNQDKLLEKCLYKKPQTISFRHCLERDPGTQNNGNVRRKSGVDDDNPTAMSA